MTTEARWFDLMREFYGVNLSVDRATMWVQLMREPDALTNVTEAELCSVIRWIRKQRERNNDDRHPNLERLISWVKWYRKETAAERRGYRFDDPRAFVFRVWSEMRQARCAFCRWNMLVRPDKELGFDRETTIEECKQLDAMAEREWPTWVRARNVIKATVGASLSQRVAHIAREWTPTTLVSTDAEGQP